MMSDWPDGFRVHAGEYRHKRTGRVYELFAVDFDTGIVRIKNCDGEYITYADAFMVDYEEVADD